MARTTKRQALARHLEREQLPLIDEGARDRIRQLLAPVSEPYLRQLLRESGVALTPLVEGVRQHDLEELERTLCALQGEYEAAAGDRARQHQCRRAVIEAKDHALLRVEQDEAKREMVLWMRVWLENPPVFSTWVTARRGKGLAGDPPEELAGQRGDGP